MTARIVECAACGKRERLQLDTPEVVELPPHWKRVGIRRDGLPIIYCGACAKADRAYSED